MQLYRRCCLITDHLSIFCNFLSSEIVGKRTWLFARTLPLFQMSFGFAVGDFIAVGSLIVQIADSLKDVGDAKSDYQELIRELESLDRTLTHIEKLQGPTADNIKCAALMCRYPLSEFLGKIKNYEKTLGVAAKKVSFVETTVEEVHLSFGKKDEVAKLRDYLNLHIGSINMQLLNASLETVTEDFDKVDEHCPEASCDSCHTTAVPSGGRKWYVAMLYVYFEPY